MTTELSVKPESSVSPTPTDASGCVDIVQKQQQAEKKQKPGTDSGSNKASDKEKPTGETAKILDPTGKSENDTSSPFLPVVTLFDSSDATVPALTEEAAKVTANQLNAAINTTNDNDAQAAIKRVLEPLTAEDRIAVEKEYAKLAGKNGSATALEDDLARRFGGDSTKYQEDIAILRRQDGQTNDAGQLVADLAKLGKGDAKTEREIREVFATLNYTQVQQLDANLKAQYGDKFPNGIQSAIYENKNLSNETKEAIKILAKGVGVRTTDDEMALARLAIANQDLSLLGEALRGNSTAATFARERLEKEPGFAQMVADKFGSIGSDFLKQGHTSLATIADKNNAKSLLGTNKANAEEALRDASPEERQAYVDGRNLALSGKPASNDDEQRNLDFYQKTHEALENLSEGKVSASDLKDQTQPDVKLYMADKLGVSKEALEKYASDAQCRQTMDQKSAKLDGDSKALVQDLLKQMSAGQDVTKLSPVDQVLYDKSSGASPFKTLLDAESALKSDPTLRQRMSQIGYDAGTAYYGPEGEKLLALDNVISQATHEIASRNSQNNSSVIDPTRSIIEDEKQIKMNLYHNGQLDPESLAILGYPKDFVSARLDSANAGAGTRQAVDQIYEKVKTDSQKTNLEVTKWEDQLTTGGSLISKLADNHKNADEVLSTVEEMSKQDWERLRNEKLSPEFKKNIASALAAYGVDSKVRDSALAIIEEKSKADTFDKAQAVHRSLLEVANDNGSVLNAVMTLSKTEQALYCDPKNAGFREQVDSKVKTCTKGAEQALALHLLDDLRKDGEIPSQEKMSRLEKVFLDYAQGADHFKELRDIEAALQDKTIGSDGKEAGAALRERLNKDAAFHNLADGYDFTPHQEIKNIDDKVLAEIICETAGSLSAKGMDASTRTDASELESSLLKNGSTSILDKIRFGYPKPDIYTEVADSAREQVASDANHLTESDKSKKIQQIEDMYLKMMDLSGDERKVADTVLAQNGTANLEDRLRSFVLDDTGQKYSDFQDDLKHLAPQQLQQLKEDYARKYQSDLDNDFLKKVDANDSVIYKNLLSTDRGDGRQDYFDNLGKLIKSESGYCLDGSLHTVERATQLYAEALQKAQINGQNLTADEQVRLNQAFGESLREYKGSKEELAKELTGILANSLKVAAIIPPLIASGGAPGLAIALSALGITFDTAGRVYIHKKIEGNDYGGNSTQIRDGLIDGGLLFGPSMVAGLARTAAAENLLSLGANTGKTAGETAPIAWPQELQDSVEPPVAPGCVRLYRGVKPEGFNSEFAKPFSESEWDRWNNICNQLTKGKKLNAEDSEFFQTAKEGRRFVGIRNYSDDKSVALNYAGADGKVVYVDVPFRDAVDMMREAGALPGPEGTSLSNVFQLSDKYYLSAREDVESPTNPFGVARQSPEGSSGGKAFDDQSNDWQAQHKGLPEEGSPSEKTESTDGDARDTEKKGETDSEGQDDKTGDKGNQGSQNPEAEGRGQALEPGECPLLHLDPENAVAKSIGSELKTWKEKPLADELNEFDKLNPCSFKAKDFKSVCPQLEQRRAFLQDKLNKLCDQLGLSHVNVAVGSSNAMGSDFGLYGDGVIRLRAEDLAGMSRRPPDQFFRTVIHEFAHHEQMNLVVRRMADQLQLGHDTSPQNVEALWQQCKQSTWSSKLSRSAVKTILRDGKQLGPADIERADKLIEEEKFAPAIRIELRSQSDINARFRYAYQQVEDQLDRDPAKTFHNLAPTDPQNLIWGLYRQHQLPTEAQQIVDQAQGASPVKVKQLADQLREQLALREQELNQKYNELRTRNRNLACEVEARKVAAAVGDQVFPKQKVSPEQNFLRAIFGLK